MVAHGFAVRPARVGSEAASSWLARSCPAALAAAFLLYVFVGVSPMAEPNAAGSGDGSSLERVALLGLAGCAALLGASRARTAMRLLRRSWPVWLLVGWFAASIAWSDFPDIALRRVVVIGLVAGIALALTAGLGSLREAHALLLAVIAAVIAADLVVTLAAPGFAITDIGVRGFHPQKNVAGLIAMIAVIAGLGWTIGARSRREMALGIAATALAGGFLLLSDSKTSIGLAILAAGLFGALLLARRVGAGSSLLIVGALAGVLAALAVGLAAFDVPLLALVMPGGDTSFTGRTEIWDFAADESARRPWTGFGYGSFWDVGPENDPLLRAPPGSWLAQLRLDGDATSVINEAHNGYLDLRLQGGWPALIGALAITGMTAAIFLRRAVASRRPDPDGAAALTFAVLTLVFLLHNMTESSIWMRGQAFGNLSIWITLLAIRYGGRAATSPA